jgi:hypothetical protein
LFEQARPRGSLSGRENNHEEERMVRIVIATAGLLALAIAAAAPAAAQFYGPGYAAYGGDPYYRGYWRAHPRTYGYAGGGYLTPRLDPRTGGTYCIDRRFTVQSGVCKPYRGY